MGDVKPAGRARQVTTPLTSEGPDPARQRRSPWLMLAMATIGFAVNFWAWALISPLGPLFRDTGTLGTLSESDVALLVAVPVVVGSLGRIVVGALTDRYGGRVMFPIVSARHDPPDPVHRLLRPGLLRPAAGRRLLPRHRRHGVRRRRPVRQRLVPARARGLAIGIFGAGMGGTAISALTTVKLYHQPRREGAVPDHRRRAGRATPSRPGWSCATRPAGSCRPTVLASRLSANARLPITWQACLLYAVAFGGYVAFSVYLPAYLKTAHGLTPADAANRMAGFVRGRGDHASGRRLALRQVRRDPGARHRLRRRGRRCAGDLGRHAAAARHRHRRVPRHGRRARLRQRRHLRPDRQGHRPVAGSAA